MVYLDHLLTSISSRLGPRSTDIQLSTESPLPMTVNIWFVIWWMIRK